ncbi:MAG TPA: hypothetical protein VFF69_08325 [Phycisphaerales bacterium]|nr:hypothetical protein [Phycisphaerales bacterium]
MDVGSHALGARRIGSAAALERWAFLTIAAAALGSCVLVYAFARSSPPVLVPRLGGGGDPASAALAARVWGSYPSFAHVVAMSFLSAAVLGRGRAGAVGWAAFWACINLVWEAIASEGTLAARAVARAAFAAGAGESWHATGDVFDALAAVLGLGTVAVLAPGIRAGAARLHRDAGGSVL